MTLQDALKKELCNKEFREAYDSFEVEYTLIQSLIDARKYNNLTQEELSKQTGIAQADISKIENGAANPTLKILKRLAEGMNMNLKIELIPKT